MAEPTNPYNADEVVFHHRKSGMFRTIHADGAWGGSNIGGVVFLTFYAQHPAIPQSVKYILDANGAVIPDKTQAAVEEGEDRDMEVTIAMTIPAAVQVRQTLDNFIKAAMEQMQNLKNASEAQAQLKK